MRTLTDSAGNDTYLFNRGDYREIVNDASGTDLVQLGSGILEADVSLYWDGSSLVILIDGGVDQLEMTGHFLSGSTRQVESIRFADGTIWNAAEIVARTVIGTPNSMMGTAGDDQFLVDSSLDTISEAANQGIDTVTSGVTVVASSTQDNVLSLGGGAEYADLIFVKSGNNLILQLGGGDQITFADYYVGTGNRSIDQLQIVIEGTDDYLPGGGDMTRDNKIETFDFDGLVAAFDAARVADPGLTSWALTNALTAQYIAGSDAAAIGGDLAYQYHRFGTLDGISFNPAIAILGNAGFATSAQTLQGSGSLQDGTPRLG